MHIPRRRIENATPCRMGNRNAKRESEFGLQTLVERRVYAYTRTSKNPHTCTPGIRRHVRRREKRKRTGRSERKNWVAGVRKASLSSGSEPKDVEVKVCSLIFPRKRQRRVEKCPFPRVLARDCNRHRGRNALFLGRFCIPRSGDAQVGEYHNASGLSEA